MWIEIFKTGEHTDSQGRTRKWTEKELDEIVSKYNTQKEHTAPIVIGHPKDNAPAYGWVESLKREGSKLLAKIKDVAEEFKDWVNKGLYKKRSISLYPNLLLRHVGFLGAQPPAIKGLKDFKFQDKEEDFLEYEDVIQQETNGQRNQKTKYKEDSMADGKDKKYEELKAQLEAEKKKREELEQKYAEYQRAVKRKEIKDFIETGIKEGKILPAWKEQGLEEFMYSLSEDEQVIEFSEDKKMSKLEWFKEFIKSFSEHELFKEFQKGKSKEETEFEEDEKLAKEIAGYAKIDKEG